MKVAKNRFVRWLYALTVLVVGVVLSFFAAGWLQSVLRLPSLVIKSRSGSASDLVVLALAVPLLIAYFCIVPKVLRFDQDEFSRMLKGE